MNISDDSHSNVRSLLMDRALEEERRNRVVRAWAILFLVMAGGYCFGFGTLLMAFSKTVFPLPFIEATWFGEWVLPLPGAILGTCGIMGWAISSKNNTMELSAYEISQIDGNTKVWDNLSSFGRVLLVIFGSALALGIIVIILRIIYKVLT